MDVYFEDIEVHIIKAICNTKERLLIAVAWFTSNKISDSVISLSKKGIDIEIIVDDNYVNRGSSNLIKLQKEGIGISFIKDLSKKSHIMHDKYCIVDNRLFITGSYNWTENAKTNDENIVIINDKELANLYSLEFRRIKRDDLMLDQIDFEKCDAENIEKLLELDIKEILNKGITDQKLRTNAIHEINNTKVNSLIRKTLEITTINTKEMVSKIFIYQNLIREHGLFYEKHATPEELANCRNKHKKDGIKDFDTSVEIILINFKLRAIQKLIKGYSILLNKVDQNENISNRIVKIIMYLNNEKLILFKHREILQ